MTHEPNRFEENWKRRSRTENVWGKTAHIYDKWVTSTKNRMLKLYITKEQEMLDYHLGWIIAQNPTRKISILEIGSGTGRTLLYYAHKPEIIERVEYLIGIDEASAMYDIAKFKLEQEASILGNSGNGSGILSKYLFLNMRAERLSRCFDGGRVDVCRLGSEISEESAATLNEEKYNKSVKVVINMLNTLGVIKRTRVPVLRNMVRAAGRDGRIVISVFNAKAFREHAEDIYTSIRNIVGKFDKNDFDYSNNEFVSESYYSHWFTRSEIEGMMKKAGCANLKTKEIDNIGLFVTSQISR